MVFRSLLRHEWFAHFHQASNDHERDPRWAQKCPKFPGKTRQNLDRSPKILAKSSTIDDPPSNIGSSAIAPSRIWPPQLPRTSGLVQMDPPPSSLVFLRSPTFAHWNRPAGSGHHPAGRSRSMVVAPRQGLAMGPCLVPRNSPTPLFPTAKVRCSRLLR